MHIEGIHHIAIIAADYEACKKFYTETLGFTMIRETWRAERQSYKLDLSIQGKYQIELFSFPDSRERASWPEARGLRHLAFAVRNVQEAAAALQAKGVDVQPVRMDELTGKAFCFFADPSGQPLELYEI